MEQIDNYINRAKVDYAIAINGKWGMGKTFYIKEKLIPKIKKQNHKVFCFSVNGVSSTENLHDIIITQCLTNYFTFDKKYFKKAADKVGKIVNGLKGLKVAHKTLNFSDYYFPDETIVIIDDLERISKNYNYGELLAYINREFIENHNFRVILIGDFTRVNNANELGAIKEKYIRWTIDFKNDVTEVFNELIKEFKSDKQYFKHLQELGEFIIKVFNDLEVDNLRTIKFFLEVYQQVYSVSKDKKYSLIQRHIIYSTIVFSIEYREGSFEKINNSDQLPHLVTQKETTHNGIIYSAIDRSQKDAETERLNQNPHLKTIQDRFGRYTFNKIVSFLDNGTKYKFFKSIFNYIISGYLNRDSFQEEIDEYAKTVKPIFKFQSNPNLDAASSFRQIDEKEFRNNIDEIFQQMDKGKLELVQFGRAVNLLVYFAEEKLLSVSKSKLKEIVRKSIEKIPKGTDTSKPFRSPEFFELDRLKKFDNVCHTRIIKLIDEENLRRRKIQSKKLLENWEKEDNSYNAFRDIITYSDSKDIFLKIKELSKNREFLQSLESNIREYYITINAGDFHSQDIPKLKSILNKMKKEKWNELDLIDKFFMKHLRNRIKVSIDHLIKTNSKNAV